MLVPLMSARLDVMDCLVPEFEQGFCLING